MRVQVNLASRPFVELRPFFLRLRLLMAALAVVGLALALAAHMLSAKAAKQQLELDHLRNQTIAVQQSRLHTEQRLRDPVNARILDRAHFLNALFLRKSFSWTAVMMDLENVLPNGVQVTSIEPAVSPDGSVVIRLRVAGERANAVQLVRNLERSRRFLQPRLAGEASQAKEGNTAAGQRPNPAIPAAPLGVEFDILADYNPLPPGQAYSVGHGSPAASSPALTSPARRRIRSATAGLGQAGVPTSAPVATSSRLPGTPSAANTQSGYPPYGVQLKPYHGPIGPPIATSPQGAPR